MSNTPRTTTHAHNATGLGCPWHVTGCSPAYLCDSCCDALGCSPAYLCDSCCDALIAEAGQA